MKGGVLLSFTFSAVCKCISLSEDVGTLMALFRTLQYLSIRLLADPIRDVRPHPSRADFRMLVDNRGARHGSSIVQLMTAIGPPTRIPMDLSFNDSRLN